jgi:hypothetical protein
LRLNNPVAVSVSSNTCNTVQGQSCLGVQGSVLILNNAFNILSKRTFVLFFLPGGLDSLGAVEYVNLVSRRLNVQLPSTLIFDYPTSAAVSAFVATKLLPTSAQHPEEEVEDADIPAAATSWPQPMITPGSAAVGAAAPLAVVSILGAILHPLQATAAGLASTPSLTPVPIQDGIVTVPLERWEVDGSSIQSTSQTPAVRFGAFMTGGEEFDCSSFGLSMNEAAAMDPQHRLLLTAAGELLADRDALVGGRSDMGVFVGISWTEYIQLRAMHGVPVGTYTAQGAVLSVACGR